MRQPRRVLIVDDEELLAENLRRYCERHGWEARVAHTGRLAAKAAAEFAPGLILLDYQLPDMNGFQSLARIRAVQRACPCVLMTAHPEHVLEAGALRLGIRHILYKPFRLVELQAELLQIMALPLALLPFL